MQFMWLHYPFFPQIISRNVYWALTMSQALYKAMEINGEKTKSLPLRGLVWWETDFSHWKLTHNYKLLTLCRKSAWWHEKSAGLVWESDRSHDETVFSKGPKAGGSRTPSRTVRKTEQRPVVLEPGEQGKSRAGWGGEWSGAKSVRAW